MNFKKYDHKKNDDGTYDILSVPVFLLGDHRGFPYNDEWYEKLKKNHDADEANDYYPSVIIGHNGEDLSIEKPSKGLLKNFSRKGKQVLADIAKISKDMFESIKNREYPHRSVEINPKAAKITALALLGGHAPFHKLPILEVFHDDEEHEIFSIDDDNDIKGEIKDGFASVLKVIKNLLGREENKQKDDEEVGVDKKFTQNDLDAAAELAKTEASKTAKSSYREHFKEEFGMYPEEQAENLKQQKIVAYKEGLKNSIQTLREKKYDGDLMVTAVVFDEMVTPFLEGIQSGEVKFAEKDPMSVEKAVVELFGNIFAKASKNELFADMGENVNHDQGNLTKTRFGDEKVDPDAADLDKKVQKYADEHKVSYPEALEAIKQAEEVS